MKLFKVFAQADGSHIQTISALTYADAMIWVEAKFSLYTDEIGIRELSDRALSSVNSGSDERD